MSKSPEEYFQDQHFAPEPHKRGVTFSEAEIAFMRKYMGLDAQETLEKLGINAEVPPAPQPIQPVCQTEPVSEAAPETAHETAPEISPSPVQPEHALPQAEAAPQQAPVQADTAFPPNAISGDAELSAAAQALSAAAQALTAAASALSVSMGAAPAAASFEPARVEEDAAAPVPEALEESAPVPAPELMEEPIAEAEPAPVEPPAAPAAEPESAAVAADAPDAPAVLDRSEVETFKETIDQQFMIIKAALDGLKHNGNDTSLSDALFRGLSTVQNSASYMGFDEIKVYAERTAGIVDQGRKTAMNFSVMTDLLEQEAGIIEDMVYKAISDALGTVVLPSVAVGPTPSAAEAAPEPPQEAEPTPEPAPEQTPAEDPPAPEPEPASAPEAVSVPEPEPEPVPEPPVPAPQSGSAPVYVEAPPVDLHEEMAVEEPLDAVLRREPELQMVGFYIGRQEFTVPTMAVQEVIRYETPAKMPAAPQFVAGIINLRGKMTPLVHLRDMLEIRQARETEDRFIIVCRRKGLQIGLIIERVHTMYRVPQADIEWGVEGLLGISNADFISGLLKLNESLVGIVSIDRIIDHVLED